MSNCLRVLIVFRLWRSLVCESSQYLASLRQHDIRIKTLNNTYLINKIRRLSMLSFNIYIHSMGYTSTSHYKHYVLMLLLPCVITMFVWIVFIHSFISRLNFRIFMEIVEGVICVHVLKQVPMLADIPFFSNGTPLSTWWKIALFNFKRTTASQI